MNKKELVARIAQSTGLPQAQVARALDSTILLIREELVANSKPPKALDSTINIVPDELVDKPAKKAAKALDSTIDLIDPALVEAGKKSKRALDYTINMIPEHLVTAGKVAIHGFGTFYTTQRKARVGRNPRTGAPVKIKAKTVPKFKFSKTLIDLINRR